MGSIPFAQAIAQAHNDDLAARPFDLCVCAVPAGTAWAAVPSATTELFGNDNCRKWVNLAGSSSFRVIANVSGAPSGFKIAAQYSTNGSSWSGLEDGTTGDLTLTGSGLKKGSWVSIVSGAKADIQVRLVGKSGDGSTSVTFHQVSVQFK